MKSIVVLIVVGGLFLAGCAASEPKPDTVQQENVRWKNLEQQQELLDSLPRAYE